MGQMLFVIPRPERVIPGAAEQAYLASADGIPWECRGTLAGEALTIERDTRESGYLYFPWKVTGRGLVQVCSGALMERTKPYNLPVELARWRVHPGIKTVSGGAHYLGTVFKMTPIGTLTTLHSFSGSPSDGAVPVAALVQGTDGNFYGTTALGGANSEGTVFKLSSSSSSNN